MKDAILSTQKKDEEAFGQVADDIIQFAVDFAADHPDTCGLVTVTRELVSFFYKTDLFAPRDPVRVLFPLLLHRCAKTTLHIYTERQRDGSAYVLLNLN